MLVFRDAAPADLTALAELHVTTWSATYPHVASPPTFAIRERQWREAFQSTAGWFCILVEDAGRLVGFAKGVLPKAPEDAGELNKIYLLTEYQRRGLGTRLLAAVARRFLDLGVGSLVLFADPQNPNCRFYEQLGAERMFDERGHFHGGYTWPALQTLLERCAARIS